MADLTQTELDTLHGLIQKAGGWAQATPQLAAYVTAKTKQQGIAAISNAATLTVSNWPLLRQIAQQGNGHGIPDAELRAEAAQALQAGDAPTLLSRVILLALAG